MTTAAAILRCSCRHLAWALAIMAFLQGCKSTPKPSTSAPPAEAPSYQSIAEAHNARVAKLETLYAQGVIELRWRDRKGRHFEQGNMELWLQLPRRTALRVEKLGEVLLWLGSDEQRYWLFDLTTDERVLHVGRFDEPGELKGGALDVKPATLLDLMALTPLPGVQIGAALPQVEFDASKNAWMIATNGRGGPLRMYFDRQSLLPTRVESLDSAGQVSLYSTLGRYESVKQTGVSPLTFPKMAQLIDIASVEQPNANEQFRGGEVKIAIGEATGDVDAGQLARVFDLNRLIQGLRPAKIEGLDTPPAGSTPAPALH